LFRQRLTQRLLGESHSTRAIRRLIPFAQVVGLVLLAAGTSQGQWVEKTIWLPDSLGGVVRPAWMVINTTNNKLYVSGLFEPYTSPNPEHRWAAVIDGSTNRRHGRIKVGEMAVMLYNPRGNKLYAQHGARVSVFDAATDTVVSAVPMPDGPEAFCLNSIRNKLYCGSEIHEITVVDCENDSVVASIPMPEGTLGMCYNSANDKLYAVPSPTSALSREDKGRARRLESALSIIDASSDTVMARIPLRGEVLALLYNESTNRLYCRTDVDSVFVVDGASDSVVARVFVGLAYARSAFCLNPARGKLYCSNVDDGTVAVIDCRSDTVTARIELGPGYEAEMMCYNAADDRVYCTDRFEGVVAVVDCERDSVVVRLAVGDEPTALCYNPAANTVYCLNLESDEVTVIAGDGDSVMTTVAVGSRPRGMSYNALLNKVYCASESNDQLMVIDGASSEVTARVAGVRRCKALCFSPEQSKLYGTTDGKLRTEPPGDTVIAVVDCTTDSVTTYIRLDRNPLALGYNSASDKLYVASSSSQGASISIVDCVNDSVRKVLSLSYDDHPREFCYNSVWSKMYCAGRAVWVIDGDGDSLRDTIPVSASSACYADGVNKIYTGGMPGRVIDGYSDTVIAELDYDIGGPSYNRMAAKVYYIMGFTSVIVAIYDCRADTALAYLVLEQFCTRPLVNTSNNKVYVGASHAVYVLDGTTDSVLCSFPAGPSSMAAAWNPVQNRVYVANYWNSSVTVIRDSTVPGTKEGRDSPEPLRHTRTPTVVRGFLRMSGLPGCVPRALGLLDISGRQVLNLMPGENDVRGLPTGVYFIRTEAVGGTTVSKVIVAR